MEGEVDRLAKITSNFSFETKKAIISIHGKPTWKSFARREDPEGLKILNSLMKAFKDPMMKSQCHVVLYRNCSLDKNNCINMNLFDLPQSTSTSAEYCMGYLKNHPNERSRFLPIIVHPGVPIIPTTLVAPLSPEEKEVLIPPLSGNIESSYAFDESFKMEILHLRPKGGCLRGIECAYKSKL